MSVTILHGDCIKVMQQMDAESIDAIVTDPPYELTGRSGKGGFMGKAWDGTGVAFNPETWLEALRVLKPGGHLLAFGGTRTWHRLAVSLEDAGFEIRDSIAWMYGQGFSKSWNFSTQFTGEWCSCPTANAVPYNHASNPDLLRLRGDLHPSTLARSEGEDPGLLPPMQRSSARAGMGETRAQRSGGLVSRDGGARSSSNARGEQPSVEGRLVHRAGQGVPDDSQAGPPPGAGERVRGGTSPSDGGDDREAGPTSRGGAPHQRGPSGQPTGEPAVVPRSHEPLDDGALRNGPVCARCGGLDPAYKGFGTGIKPAHEPIIVARKPLQGTVAANVQRYGTGALNIDATRIAADWENDPNKRGWQGGNSESVSAATGNFGNTGERVAQPNSSGRWPANVVLDETHEPVLRLRYNLPVEVERTIREFFNASTDHLPRLRDSNAGAAEPSATDTVLLPEVLRRVDEPEPDGRERDSLAAGPHPGIPKEDAGFSGGEGTARTGESSVDGRDLPQPWIRPRSRAGIEPGRTGDLLLDAQRLDGSGLHTRAPSSRSEILGATLGVDGACSPHKRGEGRQPSGELGTPLERGSSEDARRGGARGLPATSGERHSPGIPLEILRREVPPLWLTHFEDTGRTVRGGQAAALDAQTATMRAAKPAGSGSAGENGSVYGGGYASRSGTSIAKHDDQGGASRFFYVARKDAECDPASTAESSSSQPSELAGSAPSGVATSVHLDTARLTDSPSTSATASESSTSAPSGTPVTPTTDERFSLEPRPARRTPTLDHASGAATNAPTDTTTTTTSRSRFDGFADHATSNGMRPNSEPGDLGSRFRYCAKAPKNERPVVDGVAHPTVKPLSLMRWLVRLATPPGGTVLDPFAGSGTTLEAAILEGFSVIGIEREAEYLPLIRARIERATPGPADADQGTLDFGDAS